MITTSLPLSRPVRLASTGFIGFSALCLGWVSLLAFADPQAVMALVGVRLPNTDALSSIRGVYGGVGLTLVLTLLYLLRTQPRHGVALLTLLWGAYAGSRMLTIVLDGPLGAFGTQWLGIEAALALVGATILWFSRDERA